MRPKRPALLAERKAPVLEVKVEVTELNRIDFHCDFLSITHGTVPDCHEVIGS